MSTHHFFRSHVPFVYLALCILTLFALPSNAMARVAKQATTPHGSFLLDDAVIERFGGILLASNTPKVPLQSKPKHKDRVYLESQLALIDQKLDWAYTRMRLGGNRAGGVSLVTFGSILVAGGVLTGVFLTLALSFGPGAIALLGVILGLALVGGGIAMIAVGANMLKRRSRRYEKHQKIRELRRQRRHIIYDLLDLRKRSSVRSFRLPHVAPCGVQLQW